MEPDSVQSQSQWKLIAMTLVFSILVCWIAQEVVSALGLVIPLPITVILHLVYFVTVTTFFIIRHYKEI